MPIGKLTWEQKPTRKSQKLHIYPQKQKMKTPHMHLKKYCLVLSTPLCLVVTKGGKFLHFEACSLVNLYGFSSYELGGVASLQTIAHCQYVVVCLLLSFEAIFHSLLHLFMKSRLTQFYIQFHYFSSQSINENIYDFVKTS